MPTHNITPSNTQGNISRYNAQRHAILRETCTEYEEADVQSLFNDLCDDLLPQGKQQEVLVEIIASNLVRLQQIARAEAEAIRASLHPNTFTDDALYSERAYIPKITPERVEKLALYSRYQTATENRIYRGIAMLRMLQAPRYEKEK